MFPSEQSLSNIDQVVYKLRSNIRKLDYDILNSVRAQTEAGARGKEDLDEAKDAIKQLYSKIKEIKTKADQSETMVNEICKGIKSLDNAKKNLTNTITELRRLQMWVTAVDNLNQMTVQRQYEEAGNLLQAVNEFQTNFQAYNHIPKVKELSESTKEIRQQLKAQIMADFRLMEMEENAFAQDGTRITPSLLHEACTAVNALGEDTKYEVIQLFCDWQLREYQLRYNLSGEGGRLENTDQRYSWMHLRLRSYDEQFGEIFPIEWKVPQHLVEQFAHMTRNDLKSILANEQNSQKIDVTTLILVLQRTIDFEQKMVKIFAALNKGLVDKEYGTADGNEDVEDEEDEEEEEEDDALGPPIDMESAAGVKWKYKQFKKQAMEQRRKEREERMIARGGMKRQQAIEEANRFIGMISVAFEPYMKNYIDMERQNMKDMLDELLHDETWQLNSQDKQSRVLNSCLELVRYFTTSMKRCAALNKGQTLMELYMLFKHFFESYSSAIASKIPKGTTLSLNSVVSAQADWHMKLSDEEEIRVALILNTAEYCFETVSQLDERILELINPEFHTSVDMSDVGELFSQIITRSIRVLVTSLETRIDPSLVAMTKISWSQFDMVGDVSGYVHQIRAVITDRIPPIAEILSEQYFRFFCDKLISAFTPRYISYIYKCKKISEVGAQGMQLDLEHIKNAWMEIPELVPEDKRRMLKSSFIRMVESEVGKAQMILKVISQPPESLVESYGHLVKEGSEAELLKIMELKGMKKNEQDVFLDKFASNTKLFTKKLFNL
eukprot:TRINITY_DN4568_c0_g3_i3.p1 TRINITY_DN4568_c0_g3~~TRINITY_DN4568_c0_g3_i3.p1  ORF type:complete len:848 (+),score=315.31 TRINITY_DN4568_c0_g3_i3:203-2545(+)